MTADPHILATWLKGWTIARETAPPVADHGSLRVDVGWPEQKARYVFPDLSPVIGELASTIDDPWVFLKVCTTADALQPLLPARWMIQRPGFLMVCLRPMFSESALPEGYTVEIATGTITIVRLLAPDRMVAAMGHMVVVDGFAIYDRIETHPEHRRLGLARVVMKLLGAIGDAHGIRLGVLVATPDGRALYDTLGWELHAPYTTAVIPGM